MIGVTRPGIATLKFVEDDLPRWICSGRGSLNQLDIAVSRGIDGAKILDCVFSVNSATQSWHSDLPCGVKNKFLKPGFS